jgi:tetratricopeptide (TPR) repeat protein
MASTPETMALATRHHQVGDLGTAERLYRQVLQADPAHAEALHLLGVVAAQTGRNDLAVTSISRAIQINGAVATYHGNLGGTYRNMGQLAEAETHLRKAIELDPSHADAHYNLGLVLQQQGRAEEAIDRYREATRLKPDYADAHLALGSLLKKRQEHAVRQRREALARAAAAPANSPQALVVQAEEHLRLAGEAQRHGRLPQALAHLEETLRLCPDWADAHQQIGSVLNVLEMPRRAHTHLERAVSLNPDHFGARIALGLWLKQVGKASEAIHHLEAARGLRPESAEVFNNLGAVFMDLGDWPRAVEYLHKALQLAPSYAMPHFCLAELAAQGKYTFAASELQRMESLLANPGLPAEDAFQLHFALGYVLDKNRMYDQAFGHFEQANDIRQGLFRKAGQEFVAERFHAEIDLERALFDRRFFQRVQSFGSDSRLPVFVVGMPRSGTTLVEQILASHPQVFGAGERTEMVFIAQDLPQRLRCADQFPACMAYLDAATARTVADEHIAHLRQLGGQAERVVDKLPMNWLRLGLIATLFPRASVIHVRRNAVDVCLSCYFQNFQNLSFTCSLTHLGVHYQEYQRLMAHWHEVLPLKILDVNYEDLVADQEAVSRRLLEHCGLEWDEQCLKFYENTRPVLTASKVQARTPVYRTSVNRWKNYEKHLQPLIQALGGEA